MYKRIRQLVGDIRLGFADFLLGQKIKRISRLKHVSEESKAAAIERARREMDERLERYARRG